MKKIISTCITLMVSAACSISAFAMEVPTNTTIQDLNGVRQYIKIYTVAPDTDPQSLIDDVFEYDGYTYTYSSMTKEERSYSEKEHHTETVTADTEKSDLSVVLKALSIFTIPRVEIAVSRLQHLLVSPYCGFSRSHSSMSFPSHSASLIHSPELSPQLLANQATHSGASRAADSSETEGSRSRLSLTILSFV